MFALVDIKDYWCIVVINGDKDDRRIVKKSPDLHASEWIEDDNLEYSNIYWMDRHQQEPGVYKLVLEPSFLDDEDGAESFDSFDTISYELLYKL